MTSEDVRCLACRKVVYLPAHCGKCGAALPELIAKPEPVSTDTEDPNIATLREALAVLAVFTDNDKTPKPDTLTGAAVTQAGTALSALASTLAERTNELAAYQRTWGPLLIGAEPVKCLGCYNRTERITELEASLAERDRRIAEQQSLLRRFLALTFEGGAPDNLIEAARTALATSAYPAPAPGELDDAIQAVSSFAGDFADAIEQSYVDAVCLAARSWQRLQWRPASEAPSDVRVMFFARACGKEFPAYGYRRGAFWVDDSGFATYDPHEVLGWLPLDALPALNGGDDEEAPFVCPGCHAVAPERCLPGCIDDEIEREREGHERGECDDHCCPCHTESDDA